MTEKELNQITLSIADIAAIAREIAKEHVPRAWSIEECAKHMDCGRDTIRMLVNGDYDFPFIKIGKKVIIPIDSAREWFNQKAHSRTTISRSE